MMLFKNLFNSNEEIEQNENSQTSLSSAFTSDGETSNDEDENAIIFSKDFINRKRTRKNKK
jgi:hypothetical protein